MKTRLILAVLLAAPLAVVSLAIVNIAGLPVALRYIVSPGFIFGMNAAPSGSWIGDISDALRMAIAGNEVYYAILIFLLLSWTGRGRRRAESTRQERDAVERRRAS
ncbi:MAG TPA: hypothetical protein VNK23_12660 [Candidatus Dormibacteraeota bacterium]|nr:hypothetical protein [Candidatus Dormibacteraeota bacterium]